MDTSTINLPARRPSSTWRQTFIGALFAATMGCAAQAAPAPLAEEHVLAATFNVRYQNAGDDKAGNGWSERKKMVSSLVRFHDFDLIGLQEAMSGQLEDILHDGGYEACGVGRDDGNKGGEFCAILIKKGRFKVEANGTFWLSGTPGEPSQGWDGRHRRICTWTRLVSLRSGRTMLFMNTHLDNIGSNARLEGARLLLAKLEEIRRPGEPVLLLGDFNSTKDTPAYGVLSARLRDTMTISERPPYGPWGTVNRFTSVVADAPRIDHIWVTEGVRVLRHGTLTDSWLGRFPSDHFPVMAELVLGSSPSNN